MGANTIGTAVDGTTIPASDHNGLKQAMIEDFIARNNLGAVQDKAGNLGTSLYRWAKGYIDEVFVGVAANNLKIHEGATNELWLDNSDGEQIRIKADAFEFYTNNILRFAITPTGIDWTGQPDFSIVRDKIAHKNFGRTSIGTISAGGGAVTSSAVNLTLKSGRWYRISVESQKITAFDVNAEFHYLVNGGVYKEIRLDTGNQWGIASDFKYYQAGADGAVSFTVRLKLATITNAFLMVEEI